VSRGESLGALFLFLCFLFLPSEALVHKLDVDTVSVRVDTRTGKIDGQLLLDPDITRPGGPQTELQGPEKESEAARLLSFVREHVAFQGKGKLALDLEVRELYVKGGAVPADSVIFHASLPEGTSTLSVSLVPPLERVAISTTIDHKESPAVLHSGTDPLVLYQSDKQSGEKSETAPQSPRKSSPLREALEHVATGFVHIVPLGWDHILFVVALTLGSLGRYRRLILELSAFTLAHTLTLGLGALRVVVVPASVVEPLIAFSIAAAAAEYLFRAETPRLRFSLAFGFGLLHGLGFAGALLELGFSGGSFLVFLACFNLGVEFGQLAVVGLCLALLLFISRWPKGLEVTLKTLAGAIALCGIVVGVARVLS
jgi:hypothetical protein